jgi:pyruvate/2-oxoglutarate dehydrogenase complex dihydrolipoamide dehydrogenase (E3) component
MTKGMYDIIVIGCGSGGLSIGLFMGKAGFKVLMVDKTDKHIRGECLNDGCVPSKAFIHVARIAHNAQAASHFGVALTGKIDIQKAISMCMTNKVSSGYMKMQRGYGSKT